MGIDTALLPSEEHDKLSQRLQHAVSGFVDGPRAAVEEADQVLQEVTARFSDAVNRRRSVLRGSWRPTDGTNAEGDGEGEGDSRGETAASAGGDTEQLRLALRDYRELTERLLRL